MAPSSTLEGKIAFITGSTRGIGWATAQAFAQAGATVIVNGRGDSPVAEARAEELRQQFGGEPMAMSFDAGAPAEIKKAYRAIFQRYKRLDVLVNNAGVMRTAVIGMMSDEMLWETFAINTIAVAHHVQEGSRLMGRNKSGTIVNLASIAGRAGAEGQLAYSASKSALVGLTRSAAKELAPKGIRVNAVAPGMIETDLLRALPQEKIEERIGSIRMGRLGRAAEVANVILFLCSDAASYVTGQVIGVDGGMVL
jgi:3-oxoacyl-[acyl-carrier protein] reductase